MRNTVVFATSGGARRGGPSAEKTPTPLISVLVFDYAGVSGEVLDAGLRDANVS